MTKQNAWNTVFEADAAQLSVEDEMEFEKLPDPYWYLFYIRQVRMEGSRQVTRELPFYNLDMIISLGYRVKSSTATHFRKWATQRLKEYIQR